MEKAVLKRIRRFSKENQNPSLLTCLKGVGLYVSVDELDFSTFCGVFVRYLSLSKN